MAGPDSRFETLAVGGHDDRDRRAPTDVVDPLHLSTTYTWDELDKDAIAYEYSRIENPTRDALEDRLATLEGGEHARAFASGTAAIFTAILTQVGPGGHVVAFDDLYSGTERMLSELFAAHLDVDVSYVDARDASNVADAVRPETELIWLETPTNPMLRLCDVAANAAVAEEHGVPLGIDSTFMSPYFQQPLDRGADLVVHSTTKYLNGHSDSNGGVVVTSDDDVADALSFAQGIGLGNALSPFDSFLVTRGLKTLALRMERHEKNALRIARFLDGHERVRRVHYPGLESHPQHDLARRQTSGFGGMLSFEFDGSQAETAAFVDGLEEFSLAVSLGGVESLVEVPSLMTHDEVSGTDAPGDIPDTLVRVSVGVEHVADLLDDLRSSFPD